MGIYRENTPAAVREMIEDAKRDGVTLDDAEIQYEMDKADHWCTIGTGIKDYYR